MRKYTSDFDRGRRQQQIIEAAKDKVLGQGLGVQELKDTYWPLLETLNANITYDIDVESVMAGLALLNAADKDPMNVVLDYYFGGNGTPYKYITSYTRGGASMIKPKDETYKAIQGELDNIWANADFYKDEPRILVSNRTEAKLASDHLAKSLYEDTNYVDMYKYIDEAALDGEYGILVYDFTKGTKSGSLQLILDYLGVETAIVVTDDMLIKQSSNDEDFLIVVNPDKPVPTESITTTL